MSTEDKETRQEDLLKVRDLKVYYVTSGGTCKAVNGVDLEIRHGETVGLVGETGAGKTTTALSIMNLIPKPPGKIMSGEILVDGQDVLKLTASESRKFRGKKVSMIFQDPMTALNPVETVGDQIMEVIQLHDHSSKAEAAAKAKEMLELVGIPADRFNEYPHQLSGGMKQRIVIAISVACQPELILADEPTTALDVTIQAQVLSLLGNLKERLNTSMLLITHDLGIVAETCDRVAVMYAGYIIEKGTVRDVYRDMAHPYTIGLFDSIPDLDKDEERIKPIPGLMPDPANLPTGCPFWPRCPAPMDICMHEMPPETEVSPGHVVRCHLHSEGVLKYE